MFSQASAKRTLCVIEAVYAVRLLYYKFPQESAARRKNKEIY